MCLLWAIARRPDVVLFTKYLHYLHFDYKLTRIHEECTWANHIKNLSTDSFTV